VDEIFLPGILDKRNAISNSEDDLILTGDFGARISTFDHYGWRRGFLHKYDLNATLGVSDFSQPYKSDEVTIFPNPAIDIINIRLKTSSVKKISIYDLTGKLIFKTDRITSNVANLSKGIYLIEVITDTNQTFSSKFIKN
jgi:hypothetical protein